MKIVSACGVLWIAPLAIPSSAAAQSCSVPSASYPTIQAAIDDTSCAQVTVAAGIFAGSVAIARDVTVGGASSATTVITGQVVVTSGTVVLEGLRVAVNLVVEGGAQVSGLDLLVTNDGLIFFDGFEGGDTTLWAITVG